MFLSVLQSNEAQTTLKCLAKMKKINVATGRTQSFYFIFFLKKFNLRISICLLSEEFEVAYSGVKHKIYKI